MLKRHLCSRFVTEHPCCKLPQRIELVGRPRAMDGSADLRFILYPSIHAFAIDGWQCGPQVLCLSISPFIYLFPLSFAYFPFHISTYLHWMDGSADLRYCGLPTSHFIYLSIYPSIHPSTLSSTHPSTFYPPIYDKWMATQASGSLVANIPFQSIHSPFYNRSFHTSMTNNGWKY